MGSSSATFDAAKTYRYRLERSWGESGTRAVWIMLNPSTAGATQDDNTIRRVSAFTRSWGLDGLIVVNLFALRATNPRALRRHPDPVGPANDQFIEWAVRPGWVIVAAWGAHPLAASRAREVTGIIARVGEDAGAVTCLGFTKAGFPKHPLFVRGDTGLIGYLEAA